MLTLPCWAACVLCTGREAVPEAPTAATAAAALLPSFPKLVPFSFAHKGAEAGTGCQDGGGARQVCADTSAMDNSVWLA